MSVERSDGVNYAPFMVRKPGRPDGTRSPKNIFQTEGFTDHYSPNAGDRGVRDRARRRHRPAARREGARGHHAARPRDQARRRSSNNVDGVTAVLAQYKQAGTSDGHFVVFDIALGAEAVGQFLGTLAATGQATVVSP